MAKYHIRFGACETRMDLKFRNLVPVHTKALHQKCLKTVKHG